MQPRSRLLSILVLTALVRLALVAASGLEGDRLRRPDSITYENPAASLVLHGRFAGAPGPDAPLDRVRTPGYPAFLAAVGLSARPFSAVPWPTGPLPLSAVVLAQIALALAIVALTHELSRRIAPEQSADLAALLVALDPPSVCHSLLILTETLFTAVFALALLLIWKATRFASPAPGSRPAGLAVSGFLLLGCATLVRPVGLYLIPVVVLWFAASLPDRPRPWRATVVALAAAAGLGPPVAWMARNASIAGFHLSAIEGQNLLYYRAAAVVARVESIAPEKARASLEHEFERRAAGPEGRELGDNGLMQRMAFEIARAHPVETTIMMVRGAFVLWIGPGTSDLMILMGCASPEVPTQTPSTGTAIRRAAGWLAVALAVAWRGAMLLAMAAGLLVWAREGRTPRLVFAGGILFVLTVLSAGPQAYARLRVPLTPLAALVAAAAGRLRSGS